MASIFVSYRREDASGHAGRLVDRLTARFGAERVFMDVQDIRPGDRFAQSIDDTIARCDCVLAVIGPRWLEIVQERAASGEDYVRREIAAALTRDITVIPVLVGGARMPPAGLLPPDLAALGRRHAVEIRDERFEDDVTQLVDAIEKIVAVGSARPAVRRRRAVMAAAAAVLLAVAGTVLVLRNQPEPVEIGGAWIAEMRDTQQRPFRVRLLLEPVADRVLGTVQYPTGEGTIQEGQLSGQRLTFFTSHIPQFESEPATIRFEGEVRPDGIRVVMTSDTGVATGMARRADAPPPPE